jgi:acetyl esterase/lipase
MNVQDHLDPEIAELLAGLPIGAMDFGTIDLEKIADFRVMMNARPKPPLPPTTTTFEDRTIPGPDEGGEVVLRIYRGPNAGSGKPCIYWIHGGGYLFGTALQDDARLNRWVEEQDCVIVSVEYRLAPEHPYPAPLEDCYTGLAWTVGHADEIGIDTGRIVVSGASAGAGLAAALCLLARDRGEIQVAYQLLIYPMIDDRNVHPSTHIESAPVWSRGANLLGWRAYLGQEPGSDGVPIYAAPARAEDLSGLPPTFLAVGNLDVFRDENIDYAHRLLAAGVPTELHVYPGAPHGFETIAADAAVAKRCQADIDAALAGALRAPAPSSSRSLSR